MLTRSTQVVGSVRASSPTGARAEVVDHRDLREFTGGAAGSCCITSAVASATILVVLLSVLFAICCQGSGRRPRGDGDLRCRSMDYRRPAAPIRPSPAANLDRGMPSSRRPRTKQGRAMPIVEPRFRLVVGKASHSFA